jgi:hypothetical protein
MRTTAYFAQRSTGANGIRTLTAMLKRMDRNKNSKLERDELKEGFLIYGIELDDSPVGGPHARVCLCVMGG